MLLEGKFGDGDRVMVDLSPDGTGLTIAPAAA
jgi:hypothetical protein